MRLISEKNRVVCFKICLEIPGKNNKSDFSRIGIQYKSTWKIQWKKSGFSNIHKIPKCALQIKESRFWCPLYH